MRHTHTPTTPMHTSQCFHFLLSLTHCPNFFVFCSLSGLVVPVDEEHSSHLILGVLLTLRYLMPLLQQQDASTSLKGSFGVMRKEADVSPTPEQLIQVRLLCIRWFKKKNLLEEILNSCDLFN